MSKFNGFKRIVAAITTGAALILTGLVVTAAPASAAVCGFQGVVTSNIGGNVAPWEQAIYNYCGPGNVKIRVQYYYAERDLCVTPVETLHYANPKLGGLNFAY
ncbi:DUF6355 family natural product biosynthesis protein [Paenarthrobacter sp. 4246]|uniref:DUF6355 family natural product biosynthesis protein n=1 Tax=Paenarthrobacter sp. 4246 TaxID=3156456 RepID=UPI003396A705